MVSTLSRLALGLVFVVMVVLAMRPASAQPRRCASTSDSDRATRATVRVDGTPSVASAVAEQLAALGIAAGTTDCSSVEATVRRDASGLVVLLRDSDGRDVRRVVSDERLAAIWIESWARRDLGAPLLRLEPASLDVAASQMPERVLDGRGAAVLPPSDTPNRSPAMASRWRRGSVQAGFSSLTGSDESTATAIGGDACIVVGTFCVGLAANYSSTSGLSVNEGITAARRRGAALLASLRRPIAIGRASIVPSLGAGLGWTNTRRDNSPAVPPPEPADCSDPNMPDPIDPMACDPGFGEPPYFVDDNLRVHSFTLRLRAGVDLVLPINEWLAVDLGVGVEVAPGAHTNPFVPRGDVAVPEMDIPRDDPLYWLPGEAGRVTWWGIGLRMGAR